ncbi:3-deoxy-manno-octulosonate cytidylyltransferase [Verrucomicrobium sp. 3C]|uniref:3-deoxy-manno-octulosonate cytidylyltransferase n=1 Tax=Verrucomicrobium sp. 3C TaxID=1134055 RepID=UPI000364E688|nr:3-deoxy-manno-octulosonate cytidylyltransferase [Verrucomicrobium sp. 3C]
MAEQAVLVIPARWASTRFPGKPLAVIAGKPLIQWTWEAAKRCRKAREVVVATDDRRILDAARAFGAQVELTRSDHRSGTDRMAEIASRIRSDLYVNLQGDEPAVDPEEIDRLIDAIGAAPITTFRRKLQPDEAENPNVIKVVCDRRGYALYFSRAVLPFVLKVGRDVPRWAHVGIYAFRSKALRKFAGFGPGELEQAESLEQLRALENAMSILTVPTAMRCLGVDIPEDIERVERILKQR